MKELARLLAETRKEKEKTQISFVSSFEEKREKRWGQTSVGQSRGEDGLSTEGSVPIAHDALHHEHWVVIGTGPANSLDGDGDVASRHGVISNLDF